VAWMRGVDAMVAQIRQGGSRTAALMWMLNDWHPDMIEFINQPERFKRANFSVGISDLFMEKVQTESEWNFHFPRTDHAAYNVDWKGDLLDWVSRHGRSQCSHYGSIQAKDLFGQMARSASRLGSPGMVFMNTCQRMSNTSYLDEVVATNPCGEQPLPVYGSCNLGSINLVKMWDESLGAIDHGLLNYTVINAVRFMDRVTDLSKDILKQIGDLQRGTRRVGLGTMGLADVLIMAEIRYGSDECLKFIDEVYSSIRDSAYMASIQLATEIGCAPYLDIDKFLQGGFIKTLPSEIRGRIRGEGIRNLALLSQAPTGTTALLAGVSSGIEPIFSKTYVRTDATGVHKMQHPAFVDKWSKDFLVTAHDIPVKEHIAVQARIQKYVDSAVSKTINMPACATIDDICEAYMLAWKSGCKGITVFKNGSADGVCEICDLG